MLSQGTLCSAGKTGSSSANLFLDHQIQENRARRDLKSSSRHLPAPRQNQLHAAHHLLKVQKPHEDLTIQMQFSHQRSSLLLAPKKPLHRSMSYCSSESLLTHSNSCCYRGVQDLITKHLFIFHLQSTSQPLTN